MDKKEAGTYALAAIRILIGWMMIWAFFDKLFGLGFATPHGSGWINGVSPSSYVVYVTGGLFKDLFTALAGNLFIDILMMSGLLILGITLIAGIAPKLTTFGISIFMIIMFMLRIPPTNNPVVDEHIVYLVTMIAVYFLGGFERLSLYAKWKELRIVKMFPILE